jgi:HEAT repeat protein
MEELVRIALHEADENIAWDAVSALHSRGTREVFAAAARLCQSEGAKKRRIGADMRGQVGVLVDSFAQAPVAVLLTMLEREEHPKVFDAIGIALGHRHDPRAIPALARCADHPCACVRSGVVSGLCGHEDARAITTLIQLSRDEHSLVREWATFGLGAQVAADTAAIRGTLAARLTDPDVGTRYEANAGLARRKVACALQPLLAALEAGERDHLLFEAAAEVCDVRLCPMLLKLRAEWQRWQGERHWLYPDLAAAIARCDCATNDADAATAPHASCSG